MRVYRRKEFLTLPSGTIYAKGTPWYFVGFSVKGDTLDNDWAENSPMWVEASDSGEAFERLECMLETGASFPLERKYGRDGAFNDDEVFLVPERADLEALRGMIDAALAVAI